MGMDVYGREPKSEAGKYFRANVWSWRPIHSLMAELCSDVLDEDLLRQMAFNDGEGPMDQATCDVIAERFNGWLEHNADGVILEDAVMRVNEGGCFINNPNPGEGRSAYSARDEHLKEWVAFLRDCGGFQVH